MSGSGKKQTSMSFCHYNNDQNDHNRKFCQKRRLLASKLHDMHVNDELRNDTETTQSSEVQKRTKQANQK